MRIDSVLSALTLLAVTSFTDAQYWTGPSASVQWTDASSTVTLQHIRLYAQDVTGRIMEWQWDDANGTKWTGPSFIGATARYGTAMTAVNSGSRLRIYYQRPDGGAFEHVYENGWMPGAHLP